MKKNNEVEFMRQKSWNQEKQKRGKTSLEKNMKNNCTIINTEKRNISALKEKISESICRILVFRLFRMIADALTHTIDTEKQNIFNPILNDAILNKTDIFQIILTT